MVSHSELGSSAKPCALIHFNAAKGGLQPLTRFSPATCPGQLAAAPAGYSSNCSSNLLLPGNCSFLQELFPVCQHNNRRGQGGRGKAEQA